MSCRQLAGLKMHQDRVQPPKPSPTIQKPATKTLKKKLLPLLPLFFSHQLPKQMLLFVASLIEKLFGSPTAQKIPEAPHKTGQAPVKRGAAWRCEKLMLNKSRDQYIYMYILYLSLYRSIPTYIIYMDMCVGVFKNVSTQLKRSIQFPTLPFLADGKS